MTNHYHILVETPDANLSQGMGQLNGAYTQNFNRVYARVGHVFQGLYKALMVERFSYFLELAQYPRNKAMVRSYLSDQHAIAEQ